MACKSQWDWVMGVQVVVFTTYLQDNQYKIKITCSAKNIPNNPVTTPWAVPWREFTAKCKSHNEASTRAFNYTREYINRYGSPVRKET